MEEYEQAETIHEFWKTQPVPQTEDQLAGTNAAGPIETKTVEQIPTEPYPVASSLEWWNPNVEDDGDLDQIYELLRDNYVEDNDSMFRFKYSKEFLKWALTPPDFIPDWHLAVRRKKDKQMLAFISGIPMRMRMGTPKTSTDVAKPEPEEGEEKVPEDDDKKVSDTAVAKVAGTGFSKSRLICEINFLCTHKNLRSKRMTPLLVREITRRVNLRNIWQAIYTAGVMIPTPFAAGQYYHRSLNPEKLVSIRFSSIPPEFERFQNKMAMMKRYYAVPSAPQTPGWRSMKASDVHAVTVLLNNYLTKFSVAPTFNEATVRHQILPRKNVVYSYVIADTQTGKPTDFVSFYSLPSTVIGNSKYSQLNAAYVFYYAATTVSLEKLMTDAVSVAIQEGFDVLNMVDILDNRSVVTPLKFGIGDGKLYYYFYNWSYPKIDSTQVALVML